ncbi:unnamed protein product, partial [Brachionus calyciflorus]
MKGSTSHASLAKKCSIFRTAEVVCDILPSIRDFLQMTLVDFTNSIIDALGEDNSKNLNRFRIKLAQYSQPSLIRPNWENSFSPDYRKCRTLD